MRGLICGPKLAACGMLLSAWGVVMLAMLGIFFSTHSAVLIEDLPLNNQDFNDTNPPQKIYNVYNGVGYNCFIAAAVYVVVGVFSCCQLRLHRTKVHFMFLCSCLDQRGATRPGVGLNMLFTCFSAVPGSLAPPAGRKVCLQLTDKICSHMLNYNQVAAASMLMTSHKSIIYPKLFKSIHWSGRCFSSSRRLLQF